MLNTYKTFLEKLDEKLDNLFNEQAPYIFCKRGCSYCCSLGEYPLSRIEFEYLKEAIPSLSDENKKIVFSRIKKLNKLAQKSKNKDKRFEHCCPFLINNECCIYSNRPIICRTFGLIKSVKTADNTEVAILPDCIHKNLNYSNVFDFEKQYFDTEKIKNITTKNQSKEPMPYDISLPTIHKELESLNISMSERKNMIEFLQEITNK
jgi:Fe-S-cluster containining protein